MRPTSFGPVFVAATQPNLPCPFKTLIGPKWNKSYQLESIKHERKKIPRPQTTIKRRLGPFYGPLVVAAVKGGKEEVVVVVSAGVVRADENV